ncbi:MAG: 16S rRNA (guanine(527)-N(7))-methyltransferase RsmG [Spirochaetaceae bacterium]|nr:16S rRNA (guanine(527)-N(7))-methyltransferase RsmG [Spirochaetaceae bacterium]
MHLCVDYLEKGLKGLFESRNSMAHPAAFGLTTLCPHELADLLKRYCDEIELFNSAYGLVSVKNRDELIVKHILDSLAPLNIIKQHITSENFPSNPKIADAGSGAGLPGVPLAMALPGVSFSLIERMGRRAGFLRNTAAVLGLSNVEILEVEFEKAGPAIYDMICFRAFRPLTPEILKKLFRLLKPCGCLAAYKGRREVIDTEMTLLSRIAEWKVIPCPVPFLEEERNLVLIKRTPYNINTE